MANDIQKHNGGTGVVVVKGVSYARGFEYIGDKKVKATHVSRCKDDKDVYVDTVFDYSNVDEATLYEIAARTSVIACRLTEFRTVTSEQAIASNGQTLQAEDYFKRERATGPKDPVKTVTKLIKKMSAEERAEMIAMLQSAE